MNEMERLIVDVEQMQGFSKDMELLQSITSPLIQQYVGFKQEKPDHVLFMQVGDFYELYASDAEQASVSLSLHLTSRTIGGVDIPMCGFPAKTATDFAQKLAKSGYQVAMASQSKSEEGDVSRAIDQIFTPSTVYDEAYVERDEQQYLMTAYVMKNEMGVALVDTLSGEVLTHRVRNQYGIFDLVSRYQPKEVGLYLTKDFEPEFLSKLKQDARIQIFKVPYFYDEMKTVIQRHKEQHFSDSFMHYSVIAAHYFALERLNAVQTQHVTIRPVHFVEDRDYMYLHKAAVYGLELFENNETRKKEKSLFHLLNQCVTPKGSRLLRKWIQEPLLDPQAIGKRYERVAYFMQDVALRNEIRYLLASAHDIERTIMRLETNRYKDHELVTFLQTLETFQRAFALIAERASFDPLVKVVATQTTKLEKVLAACQRMIHPNSVIAPVYDKRYDNIVDVKDNGLHRMEEYLAEEQERTGIKTMKLEQNKVLGYFFEVTKSQYDKLPEDFHVKKELSNKKQCVTERLVQLEETYNEAVDEHGKLYRLLIGQIVASLHTHFQHIRDITDFIAGIDVLMSFADVSTRYGYQQPEFTDEGIFVRNGKHPLLHAFSYQPVVPNHCFLLNEATYLITGPNMGGKTVYKKMVAMLTIMAQIGCFVPANLRFQPVDRVLIRIGASDSMLNHQSTFMVEMEDIAYMLYHATENSLVIIDELGRGTSTHDGISIAQAVIEHLHDHVKAKTLCSTHFHELANLDQTLSRVKNIHAEAIETAEGVKLTYRIVQGIGSKSFGIHVATLAGLPQSVIQRSQTLMNAYENEENDPKNNVS